MPLNRTLSWSSYFDVIKKPMDLSTVQQKLQSGRYRNRDAFRTDVLLMISNAKQYNAPGSVVHEAALALDRIFEKRQFIMIYFYDFVDSDFRMVENQ
jgi:transcription initiation factor TFIID subunit 2